MPETTRQTREPADLAASRRGADAGSAGTRQPRQGGEVRGFAASGAARSSRRKTSRRRSPSLSKADWGPLGKHPDLDAIVARQRLRLPLSGRLSPAAVNQAWKRCAAEHHPDRGGAHDTMQLVNGARDLLLGRGEA
jgi:hypothetical protein